MDRKQSSKAKQWAQKRNFTIRQLRGVKAIVSSFTIEETLTEEERYELPLIKAALDRLILNWKNRNPVSKAIFLERR